MKYTTIIFDLDGTLLNTLADLAAATNHALAEHKLPQRTTDEVRRFVGNGIRKLIERAAPLQSSRRRSLQASTDTTSSTAPTAPAPTKACRSFCSSCALQAAAPPLFPTRQITAYKRWLSNTLTASSTLPAASAPASPKSLRRICYWQLCGN